MVGNFVVPGVVAFLLVCLLTPIARRVALRNGITDKPAAGRYHRHPTPCLGGVALALGCVVAGTTVGGWGKGAYAVAAGAVLVAVVGFLDDLHSLHPAPRLLVETAAALTAAAAGARVEMFGGPLDWVVTVAWIVVITNSFNLLDNMDGAAAGVAAVTAVGLTVAAAFEGQLLVAGLAAVVAGACLGFLVFNWSPARIFMGDAGSLFLGYLLAVVALEVRFATSERLDRIVAVLLLSGMALFDTTLVTLSRRRAGRPISVGGTDHFSHRLNRLGAPVRLVAFVLAAVTAVSCTLGLFIGRNVLSVAWAAPVPFVAATALYMLMRMDVYAAAAGRLVQSRKERRVALVPFTPPSTDIATDLEVPRPSGVQSA